MIVLIMVVLQQCRHSVVALVIHMMNALNAMIMDLCFLIQFQR